METNGRGGDLTKVLAAALTYVHTGPSLQGLQSWRVKAQQQQKLHFMFRATTNNIFFHC